MHSKQAAPDLEHEHLDFVREVALGPHAAKAPPAGEREPSGELAPLPIVDDRPYYEWDGELPQEAIDKGVAADRQRSVKRVQPAPGAGEPLTVSEYTMGEITFREWWDKDEWDGCNEQSIAQDGFMAGFETALRSASPARCNCGHDQRMHHDGKCHLCGCGTGASPVAPRERLEEWLQYNFPQHEINTLRESLFQAVGLGGASPVAPRPRLFEAIKIQQAQSGVASIEDLQKFRIWLDQHIFDLQAEPEFMAGASPVAEGPRD